MKSKAIMILLVDDDADTRALVREAVLAVRGDVEVCELPGAAEAIEYVGRCLPGGGLKRPDLIYLDVQMPGQSGQAVLHAVKGDRQLRDIPVVMLTGVDDEAQKRQAALEGANSYVLKPASATAMLQAVQAATRYWLNLHQLSKA